MTRDIHAAYTDPIDLIWLSTAHHCGINVIRDDAVFAAWDGKQTLRIGTAETLDPDDSLAQMILHELCHALVAGPSGISQEDWGLNYDLPEDHIFEHAALRLQAALADRVGMRSFFASTTDFRTYFDRIPDQPLQDQTDKATQLAIDGLGRWKNGDWYQPIQEALLATSAIAQTVAKFAQPNSLWHLPSGDSPEDQASL